MELKQKPKALLVGVYQTNELDFKNSIEELGNLAAACDIEVVGEKIQKLNSVNSSYYIGKGKLQEVLELLAKQNADLVIFNDELSP